MKKTTPLLSSIKHYPIALLLGISVTCFFTSCDDDDETPVAQPSFEFEATGALEFGIPLEVQFIDNSTNVDGQTSYVWDFGDGSTSTESDPVHTYATGGEYEVTLTLTNSAGKSSKNTRELELSSPLVGTWKLDSMALSTVDSFAIEGVRTALEYGNPNGWDGKKWTKADDDGQGGYVPFWSNLIFANNYLGRKSLFGVEYTFTADGKMNRDENGNLPGVVYFSPESDSYSESDDWKNGDGQSLNDWKSGEFNWSMDASSQYPGRTELTLNGKKGGFLGIYFAGSEATVPSDSYVYTIALVNNSQLIISGVSNLGFGYPAIFVLKFKRVS